MLSVIPDIDILIETFIPAIKHRGPTHSIVVTFIIFVPMFSIYRRKAIPYLLATIQHSLIGDYISGGPIQLLWPITAQYYGKGINIRIQTDIVIEWILFLTSIVIMLKTKDTVTLFQRHNSNLILIIPALTTLLPTFLSFPLEVPTWLIPPHLAYISLFSASIIVGLFKDFRIRKLT